MCVCVCVCVCVRACVCVASVTTLAGLGPALGYLHACSLCLYSRLLGTGVSVIGWVTKALIRRQTGELWSSWHLVIVGRWIEIGFGYSLDFGLSSSFVLNYP